MKQNRPKVERSAPNPGSDGGWIESEAPGRWRAHLQNRTFHGSTRGAALDWLSRHGENRPWWPVVFAADLDEEGNCPHCHIDYADCVCPGPSQDDEFEYREHRGILQARTKTPP